MTPAQTTKLQGAADTVAALLAGGDTPEKVVATLVADHGARLSTKAWTNAFRFGGLAVTCTWSADKGLLENWRWLATLRLMAARQGGAGAER